MRSDLGAMGLSKLNCKEIYTYIAPLKSTYRSSLRLIQTYDIGFFFPNSTLTSKPLRQSAKAFSYKPSHKIKSNSSSLFTPTLSLFKARRRFLERINPAFMSYTHAICGGAQKSARAYAKVPAGLSKGSKAPVKPNLVFRLLASHRSNAMRPLKRKFRTALGVQTFNLKKLTQFKVNLKKKHHWF
jgi:hypothetical protein